MVDLKTLALITMLAPAAAVAQEEPASLTLDCMASPRAHYSVVCGDPELRALAGEERWLREHRLALYGDDAMQAFNINTEANSLMFELDYCTGQTNPEVCMRNALAARIVLHWIDPHPVTEARLSSAPRLLQCEDAALVLVFVETDAPLVILNDGAGQNVLRSVDAGPSRSYLAHPAELVVEDGTVLAYFAPDGVAHDCR